MGRQATRAERTHSKAVAGRPRKVADCEMGQARLQLADPTRWWLEDPAASHSHIDKPGGMAGDQSRPHNPGFQCRKIKPQNL